MKLDALKDYLYDVVGAIYETHRELGPGLNEYVYQEGLEMEFKARDIFYEREKEFHPTYHGEVMEATYRLDFLCYIFKIFYYLCSRFTSKVWNKTEFMFGRNLSTTFRPHTLYIQKLDSSLGNDPVFVTIVFRCI